MGLPLEGHGKPKLLRSMDDRTIGSGIGKEMFYQTVYDDLEKKMLLVVYNKRKKSHYMEAAWSLE